MFVEKLFYYFVVLLSLYSNCYRRNGMKDRRLSVYYNHSLKLNTFLQRKKHDEKQISHSSVQRLLGLPPFYILRNWGSR